MNPRKVDLTTINTTPTQLRALADRLEAAWLKAKLGENVPSETIYGVDHCELRFVIDQDAMHRDESSRKEATMKKG